MPGGLQLSDSNPADRKLSKDKLVPLRMHSELVELQEMVTGDYRVRVTYQFQGRVSSPIPVAFPEPEEFRLMGFRRTWNGEELSVERVQPEEGNVFYREGNSGRMGGMNREFYVAKHVSHLPRSFQETSVLVDEYRFTPPEWEPGSKSELDNGRYVEYILVTGSAWEGVIERIEVVLTLLDGDCRRVQTMEDSYPGDCEMDGKWRSVLDNTNPSRNIRLVVRSK